jgi:hypothetical protein
MVIFSSVKPPSRFNTVLSTQQISQNQTTEVAPFESGCPTIHRLPDLVLS